MAGVTFVRDFKRLNDALAQLALPEAHEFYREALLASAELIQRESQEQYLSGQVLRVLTGELRASIDVDPAGIPRYVDVGSELPQAGALHFGARGRGLRPRPYLFPAAEAVSTDRLEAVWFAAIDRVLGAAGGGAA